MNIRDLIDSESVEIGAQLFTKDEALERLISLHRVRGNIRNTDLLTAEINERERQGNSALSGRAAIPCVSHCGAKSTRITALTVPQGVSYGAPDKKPVRLIFMIVGREDSSEYIFLKTRLMRLLTDSAFTARLSCAKSPEEFIALLGEKERQRFSPPPPLPAYDCSRYVLKYQKPPKPQLLRRLFKKHKRHHQDQLNARDA